MTLTLVPALPPRPALAPHVTELADIHALRAHALPPLRAPGLAPPRPNPTPPYVTKDSPPPAAFMPDPLDTTPASLDTAPLTLPHTPPLTRTDALPAPAAPARQRTALMLTHTLPSHALHPNRKPTVCLAAIPAAPIAPVAPPPPTFPPDNLEPPNAS